MVMMVGGCIPQGLVRAGPTIGTKQTLGKRGGFIPGFGMDLGWSLTIVLDDSVNGAAVRLIIFGEN